MKNLGLKHIPLLPLACIFSIGGFKAHAQLLPNVQTVGVLAPPNVKTDGKATEWGGRFEAYNKAAMVYYTMANDNQNLYLTVQVTDSATIAKIQAAGIALIINNTNGGKDAAPITITSFFNDQFKVKGIQEITDLDTPVSGKQGIAVASLADYQKIYTCELALSLKYMVPLINDAGTFNYNITVNANPNSKPGAANSSVSFSGRYTLVIN